MNKLIVILGPTASGKSSLAIKLAQKFNGEIISADSRQVYKGLDIGSGKVTKREAKIVPHHLLDVASLKRQYSVAQYKCDVNYAAAQITSRGKIPFLVGGTAFYIYAVIDDWQIPEVKPNLKLRKALEKKTAKELYSTLKKLDPVRAKTIDRFNRARLVRAIEIIKATGRPVPHFHPHPGSSPGQALTSPINPDGTVGVKGEELISLPLVGRNSLPHHPPGADQGRGEDVLILGLNPKSLKSRIAKNVERRFRKGLLKEVKHMLSMSITLKRLKQIGLTYALIADFITQKSRVPFSARSSKKWDNASMAELIRKIKTAEWQYAKRQMTWFKRDERIQWIKNQRQAERLIKKFLS